MVIYSQGRWLILGSEVRIKDVNTCISTCSLMSFRDTTNFGCKVRYYINL